MIGSHLLRHQISKLAQAINQSQGFSPRYHQTTARHCFFIHESSFALSFSCSLTCYWIIQRELSNHDTHLKQLVDALCLQINVYGLLWIYRDGFHTLAAVLGCLLQNIVPHLEQMKPSNCITFSVALLPSSQCRAQRLGGEWAGPWPRASTWSVYEGGLSIKKLNWYSKTIRSGVMWSSNQGVS